jgi:hypothetical protein
MTDAKFTPVEHDPFNIKGNAPGFIGALANYIVPGMIGAQMARKDTERVAQGIAHNIGVYGRALQGEDIPLDELIDASNTVAGLVATGGLGASVPKGAIGANVLKYTKQDLLEHIEPSLHEFASNIFDAMKDKGLNGAEAAYQLAEKVDQGKITIETYMNHMDANLALNGSATKLSNKVSLASTAAEIPTKAPMVINPKESALTPLDWQSYIPPEVGKAGSEWLRANPDVANLLFAKKAGFNTNVPLYKGMSHPLEGEGFFPETSNTSEPALFFATEPDVAAVYSAAPGHFDAHSWYRNPSSLLTFARAQNPFQVDWNKLGGSPAYSSEKMSAILQDAQIQNADLLAIHNINDIASGGSRSQTQIAVMDPSILRNPWAKFDPSRLGESDLLASRGLPLFIPVDHDPFAQQQGQP